MDRNWQLGDDLSEHDNLLDEFTFQDLITAVRCNCPVVDFKAIERCVHDIIDGRLEDMWFLVENNAVEIAEEATKYRGK